MHVGIVTHALFPDRNMFAREQSAALAALGHEVTVYARPERDPRWPRPEGVTVVDAHWETDPTAFKDAIRDTSPDVLHVQERRGCGRALSLGVPAVVEITSTSLRPFPLRHLALARMMWELRGDHPVGTANRALIGPLRPADFYAPNGYSSWALQVADNRSSYPPDSRLTVYQGTFDPLRRLDRMLEAFALVAKRLPDTTLCCLGGRDAADRHRVASHARQLGIDHRVQVEGRIGPEELVAAMSEASLAVSWIPSSTGFNHQPPLKVLDAQAASVPVLATPTTATRELLQAGGGRLAPPRVEPFAEAWIQMLENGNGGGGRPLDDREGFLQERSWLNIVRRYWVPKYELLLDPSVRSGR